MLLLEQFQCGNEEKEEVTTTTTATTVAMMMMMVKKDEEKKSNEPSAAFMLLNIIIFAFIPFVLRFFSLASYFCAVLNTGLTLAWLIYARFMHSLVFVNTWIGIYIGRNCHLDIFRFNFVFSLFSLLCTRDPLFWLLNTFAVRIPEHCICCGVLIKSTHIISYYLLYGLLHY